MLEVALLDGRGAEHVAPVLPHEVERGQASTLLSLDDRAGTIGTVTKNGGNSSYQVDHVVDPHRSQEEVFAKGRLGELVDAVVAVAAGPAHVSRAAARGGG